MSKNKSTPAKKSPQRTCVACGKNAAKQGFLRFVRTKSGEVFCDKEGKIAGRGAYVCAQGSCFDAAKKGRRLSKALRCTLTEDDYRGLEKAFGDACTEREQAIKALR